MKGRTAAVALGITVLGALAFALYRLLVNEGSPPTAVVTETRASPAAEHTDGTRATWDTERPSGLRTAASDPRGASPARRGLREAATGPRRGSPPDRPVGRMLAAIAAGEDAVDPGDAPIRRGGTRLVDKPDQGGFAARRITDKPDQGGYVASARDAQLDPCMKADGTRYLGTGTAVNPFAAGDPCLPRQTALAEIALRPASAEPALAEAASGGSVANPPVPPVLVPTVRLRRPLVPPPPPVAVGSDYRG